MDNLAVRSTHCTQAVIVGEEFCEFGIHFRLIFALMFDDLPRNDLVCL